VSTDQNKRKKRKHFSKSSKNGRIKAPVKQRIKDFPLTLQYLTLKTSLAG